MRQANASAHQCSNRLVYKAAQWTNYFALPLMPCQSGVPHCGGRVSQVCPSGRARRLGLLRRPEPAESFRLAASHSQRHLRQQRPCGPGAASAASRGTITVTHSSQLAAVRARRLP